MYEHSSKPLLPKQQFLTRLFKHSGFALLLIAGVLGLGILGYHVTEGLSWLDSLLNASMILSGMGQVDKLNSDAGKIFASFYALFSGIVFIAGVGLIFAPIIHRALHRFHLDAEDE